MDEQLFALVATAVESVLAHFCGGAGGDIMEQAIRRVEQLIRRRKKPLRHQRALVRKWRLRPLLPQHLRQLGVGGGQAGSGYVSSLPRPQPEDGVMGEAGQRQEQPVVVRG